MRINLKALGLALVAAFAMSAVVASAASAQTVEAETPADATPEITGTGTADEFTAGSSVVKCSHGLFEGSAESPTTTLKVTPTYTDCTAFGLDTHFEDTGCTYDFALTNVHHNKETEFTTGVTLNCLDEDEEPTGHLILTPTLFGGSHCTITFGHQVLNGDLTVTRAGGATSDLVVHGTVEKIKYRVTKSNIGCPAVGEYENGSYHVKSPTVQAFKDVAHKEPISILIGTK